MSSTATRPSARAFVRGEFDALVAQGRVDDRKARAFIGRIAAGHLTPGAMRALDDRLAAAGEAFAPVAHRRLRAFLDGKGGQGHFADPKIMQEHLDEAAHYRAMGGRLFVRDVRGRDVKQGGAGDCYFISALAAVAARRPEAIRAMVKATDVRGALDHPGVPERFRKKLAESEPDEPIFLVRFYQRDGDTFREVWIPVDADIPSTNDGPLYSTARDPNELWIPLIEKAYAAYRGSWDQIGNGGHEHTAMEHILGVRAYRYDTDGFSLDRLWSTLSTAIAANKIITAGSIESEPGQREKEGSPDHFDKPDADGLVPSHAYTVLDVTQTADGRRWVKLRNPWGETEPKPEPGSPSGEELDDGVFWMSVEKVKALFDEVSIGG